MKKTIQMEELVCPMCAQKIETALERPPVSSAPRCCTTPARPRWNSTKPKPAWKNLCGSLPPWATKSSDKKEETRDEGRKDTDAE